MALITAMIALIFFGAFVWWVVPAIEDEHGKEHGWNRED